MAVLKLLGNEKNVLYHRVVTEITDENRKEAKKLFDLFKDSGAIISEYNDDNWKITNETTTKTLIVSFDEIEAKKKLENISVRELKEIIKIFLALNLGNSSVEGLADLAVYIRHAIELTHFFTEYPQNDECLTKRGVQEFLRLIPGINERFLIDREVEAKKGPYRRELAEYESYFLFEDLINDYFPNATREEKAKYYPVYIWWKITTIIPLRVTEYLVTPKDCIRRKNEKWYITVRRTRLKGNQKKTIRYSVEHDYQLYEYETTEEIANIINEYKEICKDYPDSKGDALLSCEMYYEAFSKKRNIVISKDEKYISAQHFSLLLYAFYDDVIAKKYKYRILTKNDAQQINEVGEVIQLKDNEIIRIAPGDTRHIALQNLLLNGCNILFAQDISGHDSVDMVFHYAGNMKNLVKCKAYSLNRKARREREIYVLGNRVDQVLNPIKKELYVDVDAGKCYSPNMVDDNNATDCYAVAGNCENCRYFRYDDLKKLEKIRKSQEKEFEEKVVRIKMWLKTKNQLKTEKELQIFAEQFRTAAENLKLTYMKEIELKERESVDE